MLIGSSKGSPHATPRSVIMLYIFEIEGTDFVKMGYTSGCPWKRVCDGFWKLVHPEECCGKLGWENLRLIALSHGTLANEAEIKECRPPVVGEFWHKSDLANLRLFQEVMSISIGFGNDDWDLPLPEKPAEPATGRGIEKRPCCGGSPVVCFACQRPFTLWIHMSTHYRESCPARRAAGLEVTKVECKVCKKRVINRNLKRHNYSEKCKRMGDAPLIE